MRTGKKAAWLWLVAILAPAAVTTPCAAARGADDVQAVTATIDRLIAAQWNDHKVVPAPRADDGEFLRRVSLDLTGKIPTASEARDFLDDPRPDKRQRLVERLLEGTSYAAHATATEMRLMMPEVASDPQAQAVAPAFEAWLGEQIAGNVGSDRVARAILTAKVAGDQAAAQPLLPNAPNLKPSPLAFYLAKDVKSENLAASTARLFLGLRLECAQCHNHPFASWTRDQFWGYAAFFASLEKRNPDDPSPDAIREQADRRDVAIPGTEQRVKAAFLDGSAPNIRPQDPPRIALADWMTAPENPYFARAAANRIWAHLFGVGLVDPVDDMGADNPPSHPELLDALARAFTEHGFDRKFLIRAIVMSQVYQLTSNASVPGPAAGAGSGSDEPRLFARMKERGLTAEQLYDSLAQALGQPPDGLGPDRFTGGGGTPRGDFLETFAGNDEKPTEAQTSILQALALMNGRLVAAGTQVENGRMLTAVAEAPFLDPAGRVEALFLATLTRRPRPEEAASMIAYLEHVPAADQRRALSDVFWALLNSPEFLLNH
jgi:hypothetical protein